MINLKKVYIRIEIHPASEFNKSELRYIWPLAGGKSIYNINIWAI